MQEIAQGIADALHGMERTIEKLPDSPTKKRVQAKARLLHERLAELALMHGPAAGVDVAPLSGGGVKPN